MVVQSVTITNRLGMHARAAARFVHAASGFVSQVRVARDTRIMDGKSIMGLLLLSAGRGAVITISADGPDEQQALRALCSLVEHNFGDEPCSS